MRAQASSIVNNVLRRCIRPRFGEMTRGNATGRPFPGDGNMGHRWIIYGAGLLQVSFLGSLRWFHVNQRGVKFPSASGLSFCPIDESAYIVETSLCAKNRNGGGHVHDFNQMQLKDCMSRDCTTSFQVILLQDVREKLVLCA